MSLKITRKSMLVWVLAIVLMILSSALLATDKDNFKLISNSKTQIDLQFNLGAWNLETKTENGIEIKSVKSYAKNMLYIEETETLPIYSAMLAIPDGMDVELVTNNTSVETVRSVNLQNRDMINAAKGSDDAYPSRQIVISEPGQFRDFRVVNINVYPFQYDTKSNDLNVVQSADISLRFVPSQDSYRNTQAGTYSRSFDNLYNAMILNYDNLRDESVPTEQPVLLIIYPTGGDTTFNTKLTELVEWKKQKGYIVYTASTLSTEAGNTTTTIKNYIQNAYTNWQDRPDVVLVIGDPQTGLVVPSYSSYYGDFTYTQLTGDDEYGDIQFGRISVETSSQFSIYVNKIMSYEKNINPVTSAWLNKMLLVGDSNSSGISTYYTNYYIHEISQAVNPAYTYTELYGSYGSGMQSSFDNAINLGVGFFNYRGYLGMSGWSPNTTTTINGVKLNHGVFVTCSTGTFYSGTSATESYTRLGSDSVPAGGITAIGMATSSTHTAVNNFLSSAVFDGVFNQNMRSMGEAQLFSRNYLQNVFGQSNPTNAYNFKRYFNLIGDPTVEVWVTIPKTFSVTTEPRIITGTPMFEATVKDASNIPVPNATVNLWQVSSGLNLTAYTNAQGKVYIDIPTTLTGSFTLTVSKHDFKPATQSIVITGSGLVYQSSVIDDDNIGGTVGNSNGIINAGETIDLKIQIGNSSANTISGISTTVSSSDPYVTLTTNSLTFSNVNPGASVLSTNAIRFTVSPACPDYHPVVFTTSGSSSAGGWTTVIIHIVRSPDLDYVSHTITGNNGYLEIGETAPIYVNMINNGSVQATGVWGVLRSLSAYVTVTDSVKYFGNINTGSSYSNSANPFSINAKSIAIVGMNIPMELYLYNSSGYSDTESFTFTIQSSNQPLIEPLGQDAYGYFIFDMGDTGYSQQCPDYNWVGISPAEGGSGTALAISDAGSSGDEGDQLGCDSSETITLPFTFKFYGIDYNQITVVSNGFLAFGTTSNHDWRNGRLPGAMGPNAMIAPFWDDLSTMTGGIYVYNDISNHRYIIEWYNLRNGYDRTSEETFQVILYNPGFYPTSTGDGQIKIQYKVFNNVDLTSTVYNHGNGCTVGIKDHTGTDGLEYTYNNSYPPNAQPLGNQKALFITTAPISPNEPYLWITNTNLVDTNGNGLAEPNEILDTRLTISNWGSQPALNVSVSIIESDPWISISGNSAYFGDIASESSASNSSGLIINVLNGCPDNYVATINATITCSGYTFNRTFTILLNAPALSFSYITIQDPLGNSNGLLDPGETVTIIMPLSNSGGSASMAGNATLTCSTPGITVNDGNDSFASIPVGGSVNLSFNITASSGMSIGTIASLILNATAGVYTANQTENVAVGLIIETFESGNFNNYPWTFSGDAIWGIDNSTYYAGSYSAKSGFIGHSQSSSMQTIRVLTTGGNITFWYKVSSENNYDYLRFYIDDIQQGQWAGEIDWTQATYYVAAGTRTLRWSYMKDGSVVSGSDCAWVDNIIFPPSTGPSVFNPPQNLTASASHQSVKLDWSLPVTGSPTGYKIYKNSALLTTVTALTYTDIAVTNGTNYNYYLKAVYNGGESDPTATVQATPNAIAPTNLTAVAGNGFVNLTWNAATGREIIGFKDTNDRAISGYRVYRNGSPITTVTNSIYSDTAVINETTYTYYVTTVYSNPTGESAASNSVQAMPTAIIPSTVILGTGTSPTGGTTSSPINVYYKSIHSQSVYTAAELNAAGVYGPVYITQLGFNVISIPIYALPNYLIRMKHTTATNVANWHTPDNLVTVYSNASYIPTAGGYDMLIFDTPFLWNGVDNILVDTAFGLVDGPYNASGSVQYSYVTTGFRAARDDYTDQTNIFSGTFTSTYRPNIKLELLSINLQAPDVSIEHVAQGTRLSWQAVSGANSYKIYGSNNPDTGFTLIVNVAATEYIDTVNQPFRFYKVVATDATAIISGRE